MRTTLKRGVGRGAHNGNGKAVFPPGTLSTVTRYRQPPPPAKTALGLFWRIVIGTLVIVSSLVLAVAGGAYLYFHQSVATVRAHTPSVVRAAKTAVVVGHADARPCRPVDAHDLAALVPA